MIIYPSDLPILAHTGKETESIIPFPGFILLVHPIFQFIPHFYRLLLNHL
jgi:hypothetical protein